MNQASPKSRPRRGVRLGCLPGLLVLLLASLVFWIALNWVFEPWIYTVGGKLRPVPLWEGSGVARTAAGPFRIDLFFSPTPKGSRVLPGVAVQGSGQVCTPRGERFVLNVRGGASGRIWRTMDGHDFHISAYHRPIFWNFTSDHDWRPSLAFQGRWVGANLVMDDEGSLIRAFNRDGTLNKAFANQWHPKTGAVPVTFNETPPSLTFPPCPKPG